MNDERGRSKEGGRREEQQLYAENRDGGITLEAIDTTLSDVAEAGEEAAPADPPSPSGRRPRTTLCASLRRTPTASRPHSTRSGAASASQLAPELSWWDVLGLSLLAGIGLTVSLLIGELAYGAGSDLDNHVKIGVLLGPGIAALLTAVLLRIRDRHYRAIREQETVDDDRDGVPDAYQIVAP